MPGLVGKCVLPSVPFSRFDLLLLRAWVPGLGHGCGATGVLGWERAGGKPVRKTVSKASQGRG